MNHLPGFKQRNDFRKRNNAMLLLLKGSMLKSIYIVPTSPSYFFNFVFIFTVDPCEEMVCATMYHEICVSDGATARCECPTACTQEYQPVCGSNGKDHPNECELQLASCHDKRNYTVVYEGMCGAYDESELGIRVGLTPPPYCFPN